MISTRRQSVFCPGVPLFRAVLATLSVLSVLALAAGSGAWASSPGEGKAESGVKAGAETLQGGVSRLPGADDNVVSLVIDNTRYTKGDVRNYIVSVLKENQFDHKTFNEKINTMVLDILMYEEAVKEYPGIEREYAVKADIGKFRSEQFAPLYYNELVYKKVNPSLKEIADMLPLPKRQYEISMIVCDRREKLDKAIAELDKGREFHETAASYSDGLTREKGGRLGTIEEGNEDLLTKEEFAQVKVLKPGKYTKAFPTRIGWASVFLDRIWEPEEIRTEQAKRVFDSKKLEMERKRFQELYAGLRGKAEVKIHDNTIDLLYELLSAGKPISEELKKTVIAEVNGVPVYTAELRNIVGAHGKNDIHAYLEKRVRDEIVGQEAQRLGFVNESAATLVDLYKKRVVTRRYFEKKVVSIQEVDEKRLRSFYEKNKSRYLTPEYRKVLAIEARSKKRAEEAYALLEGGTDFREVASKFNIDEKAREAKGELGYVKRSDLSPQVAGKAFSLKEGDYTEPTQFVETSGKTLYIIVKVERITPPRTVPFEELNRQVLTDRYVAGEMENFYKTQLERIYRKHEVKALNALETDNGTRG